MPVVPPPLLQVEGLRAEFVTRRGIVHAVNGVTFDVGRGELVGVVGESGCGKSVTTRAAIGLLRPPGRVTAGSVRFDGADLLGLSRRELRRIRGTGIGFVPQNPFGALNPVMPIRRQFANVLLAHRDISDRECREIALAGMADVSIAGPERVLRGYPHELSGGMAQRVVIAMALALDPDLVIADEPTTGLDITVQRQILDMIVELIGRGHRTMLLVTHDLGVVAQYCHRVVVMYAGKVVEVGPVGTVFTRPGHPYTQALLDAVPRPGRELIPLRGRVPDLIDYPAGCPFAARCRHAHAVDSGTEPELRELAPGHAVACHLPGGVSAA